MFNLLKVIDLGPKGSADAADQMVKFLAEESSSLPGVLSFNAGKTLPHALYGGHLIWRMVFASEQNYWHCQASPTWQSKIIPALAPAAGVFVDSAAYYSHWSDTSAGRNSEGIWRCLVLAVDPNASQAQVREFERDMLLMPSHVSAIRNWSLGHVVSSEGRRTWTHVWEQEFDDLAGLHGEYMAHPIHWGLIDGWYDPESPKRIVDIVCIIHAAFATGEPVIR